MINYIWFVMIFLGLIVGIFTGNGEGISNAIIGSIMLIKNKKYLMI